MRSVLGVERSVQGAGCDIRVWSGSCEYETEKSGSDKYLCDTCGVIEALDHEVRHEGLPHVDGNYESLY